MFNYFQKLLVVLFFCIVPIVAMEEKLFEKSNKNLSYTQVKTALGVVVLAHICREKANAELLNVIETYVIPQYKKYEEFGNKLKVILQKDNHSNHIIEWTPLTMAKAINIIEEETGFKLQEDKIPDEYWKKIKTCLQNGADPNLKTKIPVLLLAVKEQKKDIFNLLLRLGANINSSSDMSIHDIEQGYTPLHAMVTSCFIKNSGSADIHIEDLLKNKANPNVLDAKKESPLNLAITLDRDIDVIKPLITYRANVNYKNSVGMSILNRAIYYKCKLPTIGALCDAGASLINVDGYCNTAFHILAERKGVQELIKTIITQGHVGFKREQSQLKKRSWIKNRSWIIKPTVPITQTLKGALLAFNRLSYPLKSGIREKNVIKSPRIPHEIQLYILSKLLAEDYFHWGLYNESLRWNYKPCPFFLLNNHVACLERLLQIKNGRDETALELLQKQPHSPEYLNIVLPLFDGSKLRHDLDEFKQLYDTVLIPDDNLIFKIYQNHYSQFVERAISF